MKAFGGKAFLAGMSMAAAFAISLEASAQDSFFNMGLNGSKNSNGPVKGASFEMDYDIPNNLITLTGNVFVESDDMNISCHKMIIYLEDSKKNAAKASKPEDEAEPERSKQPKKVECLGDVVITRKFKSASSADASSRPEQKILAGRADYDVTSGLMVFTEEPVMSSGKNWIKGTEITINRNKESAQVKNASFVVGETGSVKDSASKNEDQQSKKDAAGSAKN